MYEVDSNGTNQRINSRFKYSQGRSAELAVRDADGKGRDRTYRVIDISEQGVRFCFDGGNVEPHVIGTLSFCNGGKLEIEGEMLRRNEKEICIRLKQIVPARSILEERRFLHRK